MAGRITFGNLFLTLLVAVGGYLSYKYLPLAWTKMQLESIVKEESYAAKRRPAEDTRKAIISSAERQLKIQLKDEDIQVVSDADRIQIEVTWKPTVEFLFDQSYAYGFHVKTETVFY
jgi:hypothetical protein